MRRLLNAQRWIKNKNMRRQERKRRGGEKAKRKSQDCCDTFKPTSKFCFLCLLAELRKLIQGFVGALPISRHSRKWTDLLTATFTKHSSNVRESKTVVDSGLHVTHSGFQVLNSSLFSVKSLSFIPDSKSQDSRFHKRKFPGFRNLDYEVVVPAEGMKPSLNFIRLLRVVITLSVTSLLRGENDSKQSDEFQATWKPVFPNSQTNYVFLNSRKRPAPVTGARFTARASIVVQFHPWFKFYFPLFQTHYHILPYPRTKKKNLNQGQNWTTTHPLYVTSWSEGRVMHDTDLQTVLWQVFALYSYKELQNAILGEIPRGERVNKCSLGGHLFRDGKEKEKLS